jgi:hypothetical protein
VPKADIAAIRRRLTAASTRPWVARQVPEGWEIEAAGPNRAGSTYGRNGKSFAVSIGHGSCAADAELVSHAPEDLTALVGEVDRLRRVANVVRELTKAPDYILDEDLGDHLTEFLEKAAAKAAAKSRPKPTSKPDSITDSITNNMTDSIVADLTAETKT